MKWKGGSLTWRCSCFSVVPDVNATPGWGSLMGQSLVSSKPFKFPRPRSVNHQRNPFNLPFLQQIHHFHVKERYKEKLSSWLLAIPADIDHPSPLDWRPRPHPLHSLIAEETSVWCGSSPRRESSRPDQAGPSQIQRLQSEISLINNRMGTMGTF